MNKKDPIELSTDDLMDEELNPSEKDETDPKETDEIENEEPSDDSSEDENPEESEDTEEEPEGEEPEEKVPVEPLTKRIHKLTAQKKDLEEELKEARDEIDSLSKEIELRESKIFEAAQGYTYHGVYFNKMSKSDFNRLKYEVVEGMDISGQEKIQLLRELERQRSDYEEKMKPLQQQASALAEKKKTQWHKEWKEVEKILYAAAPEAKKHSTEILQALTERIGKDQFLEDILFRGGVKRKLKETLAVMSELGISDDVEKESYRKARPSLAVPVGKKHGGQTPKKSGAPSFTREQIEKMTLEEYNRNEGAINKAHQAGRIR